MSLSKQKQSFMVDKKRRLSVFFVYKLLHIVNVSQTPYKHVAFNNFHGGYAAAVCNSSI